MEYHAVAAKVEGIPHMTPEQGRLVYDHIRAEGPEQVLEIGTANGVGSAYMAAALEANGAGTVTTLDREIYDPGPVAVLDSVGLRDRVEIIRTDDSSYNWWLRNQIIERSDQDGNVESVYDFVYLDGAHEWSIDGLAALLVEKLMRPGGWLLLDDMTWTFAATTAATVPHNMSQEETETPHIQSVFDLLLRPHPSFSEFRVHDGWGWAKKQPGAPRTLTVEKTTQTLGLARAAKRRVKSLLSRS